MIWGIIGILLVMSAIAGLILMVYFVRDVTRDHDLVLITTTDLAESGVLDDLITDFENTYYASVDVIAVSPERVFATAHRGGVDVILAHDPARETAFVAEGHGLERHQAMVNAGDDARRNPYSVIVVNPARYPAVNDRLAQQFVVWLLSVETQNKIATFTQAGAHPFLPASAVWQAAQSAD